MATNSQNKIASSSNFIRAKIEKDISNNLYKNKLWNKSPGNSNHQSKGKLDNIKHTNTINQLNQREHGVTDNRFYSFCHPPPDEIDEIAHAHCRHYWKSIVTYRLG